MLGEAAFFDAHLALAAGESPAANTFDLHAQAPGRVQQRCSPLDRAPAAGGHKNDAGIWHCGLRIVYGELPLRIGCCGFHGLTGLARRGVGPEFNPS